VKTPNGFATHGPFFWTQSKVLRREYQLKKGNETLGQLRFEKSYGSLASAEVASQCWTFKREGFLRPRVNVRTPNSEINLATFWPNWSGGGVVEFPDGHRIHWRCTNFWGSGWSFVQDDSRQLVRFKQHGGFMKISARIEFGSADTGLRELPMLAALGWYLMLITAEDAATVALITATNG
jgi:hypothetical protein